MCHGTKPKAMFPSLGPQATAKAPGRGHGSGPKLMAREGSGYRVWDVGYGVQGIGWWVLGIGYWAFSFCPTRSTPDGSADFHKFLIRVFS